MKNLATQEKEIMKIPQTLDVKVRLDEKYSLADLRDLRDYFTSTRIHECGAGKCIYNFEGNCQAKTIVLNENGRCQWLTFEKANS